MYERKAISNGIVAGLFAGIIFAFFILLGGMTEKMGSLIGIPNKLGGLMVLFMVSILAGIFFAWACSKLINSWLVALAWGLLFGLALWFIGPLILFPVFSYQQWSQTGFDTLLFSLLGYLIYGFVLGIGYYFLKKGKLHKLKKPKPG